MLDNHNQLEDIKSYIKATKDLPFLTNLVLSGEIPMIHLFEVILNDKSSIKFTCGKILQRISEQNPLYLIPYFDGLLRLIESENNFVKWGAMVTTANLIPVLPNQQLIQLYSIFLLAIRDHSMITAGNAIKPLWQFVLRYPSWEIEITTCLVEVENTTYYHKGSPSPECKNIVIGHVLDCFDRYFNQSTSISLMMDFVLRQTKNDRASVAKKASTFLHKHRSSR